MESLDELLSSLCDTIRDKKLRSKQAAFNVFLEEIYKANKLYTLETIFKYVNEKTELNLTIETYKTMIWRAKQKRYSSNSGVKNSLKKEIRSEVKENSEPGTNVKKEHLLDNNYNDYMNACFNKEKLVQQAIENNISVDTIRSWGCANFVQVSNTLGNYIRSKKR